MNVIQGWKRGEDEGKKVSEGNRQRKREGMRTAKLLKGERWGYDRERVSGQRGGEKRKRISEGNRKKERERGSTAKQLEGGVEKGYI